MGSASANRVSQTGFLFFASHYKSCPVTSSINVDGMFHRYVLVIDSNMSYRIELVREGDHIRQKAEKAIYLIWKLDIVRFDSAMTLRPRYRPR